MTRSTGTRPARALVRHDALSLACERLEARQLFAFGLTTSASTYTIDTGAKTVFTVSRTNGDLTSFKYGGTDLAAPYSATQRYAHYDSGLSSTSTITSTVDPNGQWIKIACADPTIGVTHFYIARKGYDTIYMASYLPTDPPSGNMRFLAYLNRSVFTNVRDGSNISQSNATVEGSDVFYNTTTGYTYSKFYSNTQAIDDKFHGVTGSISGAPVGAFMDMGQSYEKTSGGPFFKDHQFQTTADATEIYNVMFSSHTQTEANRHGLHGPYALTFTNGSNPAPIDYSFMGALDIPGFVGASGRGTLTGRAGAVAAGTRRTVGLSNADAQYWGTPDSSGNFTITGVLPGTYTETLYQGELAVGTKTVTIAAGQTDASDIVSTFYTPAATFRIGAWDGTPAGFLNADKLNDMHPTDSRMTPLVSSNFVIGTNTDAQWPFGQFVGVNNSQRITFNLTAAQAASAQTLRVGISLAFAGGRPRVTVNAGQTYAWTSTILSPSNQPDSRGITRGTWRGNNTTFTYNIPTSALRAGTNTIDLPVISGSSGTGYLSPNVTYDAIDLVPTATLTNAPRVARVVVSPAAKTVGLGASDSFVAVAYDQFNAVTPANVNWAATSGAINDNGRYTAPNAAGTDTVTATSGTVSGTAAVTIKAAPAVTGFVVNDGSAQRSRVTSLTLTFDQAVDLAGGAVTLWQMPVGGSTFTPVSGFVLSPTSGGATYTLTFPTGTFAGRSLADGSYELRVAGAKVSSSGVAMTADRTFSFYRLAADINGDRTVNFSDFLVLQGNFLTTNASPTFNSGLDLNDDGVINFSDFLILQGNFLKSVPAPVTQTLAVRKK